MVLDMLMRVSGGRRFVIGVFMDMEMRRRTQLHHSAGEPHGRQHQHKQPSQARLAAVRSVRHISVKFHARFGVTPSEYRRSA